MLEVIDLHKAYGRHEVLRGVSLGVRPGTIHGLVGANGAGKTTLLNCLYGLETGFTGTVRRAGLGSRCAKSRAWCPTSRISTRA